MEDTSKPSSSSASVIAFYLFILTYSTQMSVPIPESYRRILATPLALACLTLMAASTVRSRSSAMQALAVHGFLCLILYSSSSSDRAPRGGVGDDDRSYAPE